MLRMKTNMKKGRTMWQCWILMLWATDASCAILQPQSFSVSTPSNNRVKIGDGGIRRFACPVGFFRLKRNCYYLSAGVAPWREAYFHCKDRNSTLATLDKNGKDRILRKYLMGDQFTKLERWIGGIYNWEQMDWVWGGTGEKIVYKNFENFKPSNPKQYAWHCIVMDPNVKYKWKPMSCIKKNHYICEVPAGRVGRRRRKRIDSHLVPQNQRQSLNRKGKKNKNGEGRGQRRNQVEHAWKRDWESQNRNQQWAHGVKIGSRPPTNMQSNTGRKQENRMRHRQNRIKPGKNTPKVTQAVAQGQEYTAFLGDSPARSQQALFEDNAVMNQFHAKINDLSLEEILLKT